jgi:phosphoserine aminotransferase
MSKVIKQIAHKNMKVIPEWVKNNPDCHKYDSKHNDKYLKIVSNSMSGGTEIEQKTNINKIISKVAKKVTIDKNKYQVK